MNIRINKIISYLDISNSLLKSDIWSIGCIICELVSVSNCLFQTVNLRDKLRNVIEVITKLVTVFNILKQ